MLLDYKSECNVKKIASVNRACVFLFHVRFVTKNISVHYMHTIQHVNGKFKINFLDDSALFFPEFYAQNMVRVIEGKFIWK